MAIQMRRGSNEYYNAAKMESGEFASVSDTEKLYHSFKSGTAKEVAVMDDVEKLISEEIAGIEIPQPVVSHMELTERDAADQHPIEAIKGLRAELDEQRIIATAAGESIVLTDSSDKPLEGLVLYGKTTQDGTPSPTNPIPLVSAGDSGELNARVHGKNLFNGTPLTNRTHNGITFIASNNGNGVHLSGTSTGTWAQTGASQFNEIILPPGVYTISRIVSGNDGGAMINAIPRVNGVNKPSATSTARQFTLTEYSAVNVIIAVEQRGVTVDCDVYVQIEVGDKATDYEPHVEPQTLTAQTPNGLPGIPVTSGGNYADENGQMYLSNCKNYKTGKHEHYVGRIDSYSSEDVGDTWISSTGELSVGAAVLYALSKPYQEDIDPEELSAFASLTTNKPVITILNDGGAGMAVSYVADTKAYIDNKFAALEAAILSTGGNV